MKSSIVTLHFPLKSNRRPKLECIVPLLKLTFSYSRFICNLISFSISRLIYVATISSTWNHMVHYVQSLFTLLNTHLSLSLAINPSYYNKQPKVSHHSLALLRQSYNSRSNLTVISPCWFQKLRYSGRSRHSNSLLSYEVILKF